KPQAIDNLVFCNGVGNPESLANIINRALKPVQVAAGVVKENKGMESRPSVRLLSVTAKYTGMQALRHFYSSWCINPNAHGGLELPLKVVQARLGHSTIAMTADTYGHLFPNNDDGTELAAAELSLYAT